MHPTVSLYRLYSTADDLDLAGDIHHLRSHLYRVVYVQIRGLPKPHDINVAEAT